MLTVLTGDPGDERTRHGHSTLTVPPGRRPGESMARYARPSRRAGSLGARYDRAPMDPFASPSTSARSTATAPASASPSPSCATRSRAAPTSTLASVRAQLPRPPGAAGAAAAAARGASPTGCGSRRRPPAPRPLARRRRGRPRHELRRAAVRAAAVVSVYDCWFLRQPRARPRRTSRRAGEVLRRRVARRRRRPHVQSHATADVGPRAARRRPTSRSSTSARCRAAGTAAATAGLARRPRRPPVRARPRHRRAAQEPPGARRRVRAPPPSSTGHRARDRRRARRRQRRRSTPPSPPSAAAVRRRVLRTGPVDDADEVVAAAPRRGARLPVARRGLRLPAPRGAGGRRCRRRHARRLDPRGRRRRRPARRRRRPRRARRGARRASSTTTTAARDLVAAGRANVDPLLVVGDRRRDGRPVPRVRRDAATEHPMTTPDPTARRVAVLAAASAPPASCAGSAGRRPAERITAIVNTGDDTVLHGLSISPDLDTITYTLAGAIDPERGWGLAGETWDAMAALGPLRSRSARRARRPPPRGSASATATWRRTSTARPGWPRGRRSTEIADEIAPGLGPRRPAPADDRRPAGDDRRAGRPARTCRSRTTSSACATACRSAACASPARRRADAPRRSTRSTAADVDRDRAVEPDRVDRSGAGPARHRRAAGRPAATTSSPCRPSSAAWPSRARPTGCSPSSATSRPSSAWPGSTRRSPTRW